MISSPSTPSHPLIALRAGTGAQQIPTSVLEETISDDFRTIPDVCGVKVQQEDDAFLVFVEIAGGNPNRALREKIFAKEFALMDAFPDQRFDFNLV